MDKYLSRQGLDDSYVGDDGSIRSFTSWQESLSALRAEARDRDSKKGVPGQVRATIEPSNTQLRVKRR